MTSKTKQFNANVVLENSAPNVCLNYVWIGLKFSPSSDESAPPIPPETVENMINTAHSNPSVHVRIWIDSKRLSGLQVEHLREAVKNKAAQNIEICDLRSIEAYDYHNGNLFNLEDTSPDWRDDKDSLIWRQVDCARILVCLENGFDQQYYSDTDIVGLDIRSNTIQNSITDHGVVFCGFKIKNFVEFENGFFGFSKMGEPFFRTIFLKSIAAAVHEQENGYHAYIGEIYAQYTSRGICAQSIIWTPNFDGTFAHHNTQAQNEPLAKPN